MKSVIASAAVSCLLAFAFPASAEVTQNVRIPIAAQIFVPCANGGLGETVQLSGELHVLVAYTINENTISGYYHSQPMGVSGIGLTTGDKYQGTGVTQWQYSDSLQNERYERTDVNNFRIVGQGKGNNYLVHSLFHLTINANGEVTAEVDYLSVECK